MKPLAGRRERAGFTLLEVLIVLVIIGIVLAMLLPATIGDGRARIPWCISNLRNQAIGFAKWKDDHNEQYPWQISTTNGGTMEFVTAGNASPHFQTLSMYLPEPRVLICPSDRTRKPATSYAALTDSHVSYFIHLLTSTNNPSNLILAGDRNLESNTRSLKPGLFTVDTNQVVDWTGEQHPRGGCLAFADGHCQYVKTNNLNGMFQRQGLADSRLTVP